MTTSDPIRSIVVGTDFSAGAGHALRWAVETARQHEASITLVHAVEGVTGAETDLGVLIPESLEQLEQRTTQSGIATETVFRPGRAWEVLAAVAEEARGDLLVVGARGHTAYSRIRLGSVADRTIRQAATPVVVIHEGDPVDRCDLETALVGVDFSGESRHAALHAARLLRTGDRPGHLVLLHAWQPLVEYGFEEPGSGLWINELDRSIDQARVGLERFAEQAREIGAEVEVVVRQGYPAVVIEDEIDQRQPDLVALGTRGRTGLGRFLLGSVAERIVHHAGTPVMTVRHVAALDRRERPRREAANA